MKDDYERLADAVTDERLKSLIRSWKHLTKTQRLTIYNRAMNSVKKHRGHVAVIAVDKR